ncbi:hypothetical protein BGX29_011656 [Mortierella sp. GBA35]|nr:hypothetical protein BGX29_011656 [Mortierella sp. GBA35]
MTLEALGASTYIVPFRAARRRTSTSRRSRATTLEYSMSDRHQLSVSGHLASESSSSNSSSSNRTRSDSRQPSRDLSIGDSSSAVGYRETEAVMEDRDRESSSAHWPRVQSNSELYPALSSPHTTTTAATTATATIAPTTPTTTTTNSTSWSSSSRSSSASDSNTVGDSLEGIPQLEQDKDETKEEQQEEQGKRQEQQQDEPFDPDCAICLDKIVPLRHAKAILACRHEFHLSCISMAFAMGKEMICPLCRYLHKDQPFVTLDSDEDLKPSSRRRSPGSPQLSTHTQTSTAILHEHPTSGTVLSMMPSLFETSLGHGPTAGTIRIAPNGICLRTSTWLLLYALPFTVALCFLAFVLGKVETLWSKISCLIGAAICYMVCWALVVAVMDPDHEARAILEQLDQDQRRQAIFRAMRGEGQSHSSGAGAGAAVAGTREVGSGAGVETMVDSLAASRAALELTRRNGHVDQLSSSSSPSMDNEGSDSSNQTEAADPGWPYSVAGWVPHRYAQDIQNRLQDFSEMLDRVPDMMGEW